MSKKSTNWIAPPSWVEGELRLVGTLDSRMIDLLRAIDASGSINQAAKQVGLSYKGAWQMIERANNFSPKILVSTATGGNNGGGTNLTTAGHSIVKLFTRLDQQNREFLQRLNQDLAADPNIHLLLKRLVIKTSATNQLFGKIIAIDTGSINAEVISELKGGEKVIASLTLSELRRLELGVGTEVLLMINAGEIIIVTDPETNNLSASNCLAGKLIRVQHDGVDSEVVVELEGGESLAVTITQTSSEALALQIGKTAFAVFKSNAVILGTKTRTCSC